jgi:hypothetical protein
MKNIHFLADENNTEIYRLWRRLVIKLICPHCGLKGIAKDALLAKKIRCPQCRKVSRLDETVIVPAVTRSDYLAACILPIERDGELSPAYSLQRETPTSHVVSESGQTAAPGVGICSVCGFALSYAYLEENAARMFCRLCLPV